jgi:hypothetical protein
MTITRMAFFKLLAAIGLGQAAKANGAVTYPRPCPDFPDGPCVETGPTKMSCKDGEERCPLGHCQKPAQVGLAAPENPSGTLFVHARVCSTCGIVYVRTEERSKP